MQIKHQPMRAHCARLLRDLPIPAPFDLSTFVRTVAAHRGRHIHLVAMPFAGTTYGAWLPCAVDDFIFYEQHTTPFHQQQIVLHELGHILFGHAGVAIDTEALVPYLPPAARAQVRALRRDGYDTLEEYEAEMFAWHVLERAQQTRIDGQIADEGIEEALRLLDRLEGVDDGC